MLPVNERMRSRLERVLDDLECPKFLAFRSQCPPIPTSSASLEEIIQYANSAWVQSKQLVRRV